MQLYRFRDLTEHFQMVQLLLDKYAPFWPFQSLGQHIELGKDVSQNDVVTRGSTVVAPGLAPRAAVQYTLVFDGVDQQAIWYDFVKFLKTSTDYEGVTFSEKLISFIQENSQ